MTRINKILICILALGFTACAPHAKRNSAAWSNSPKSPARTALDLERAGRRSVQLPAPAPEQNVAPQANRDVNAWPAAWDHKADGAKWTAQTAQALETLGNDLLNNIPTDVQSYCPRYAQMNRHQRKGFWIMLISVMARHESAFRPMSSFVEGFQNSKNEPVISRGLLQLSSESSQGYDCGIERETDLEDSNKNLSCGVRILNRFVVRDRVIVGMDHGKWRGAARYWSIFRKPLTEPKLRQVTRSLASCG